jgi:hypothetical protein
MSAGRGTPRTPSTGTTIDPTIIPAGTNISMLPSNPFTADISSPAGSPIVLSAVFQEAFTPTLSLLSGATRVSVTMSVDAASTVQVRPVFGGQNVERGSISNPGTATPQAVSRVVAASDLPWRIVFAVPPASALNIFFQLEVRATSGTPNFNVSKVTYDNLTIYGNDTLF